MLIFKISLDFCDKIEYSVKNMKGAIMLKKLMVIAFFLVGCSPTSNTKTDTVIKTTPQFNQKLNFPKKEFSLTRLKPETAQVVVFNTPVVYETVEAAIHYFETLRAQGYNQAYLILDSPGGSVIDGAKLGAYIKNSPMKIDTVCDGICASMAAHLFESGKTRYMTDKSTLMFHPASGAVQGTLEQMNSQLTWIIKYVDRLDAEVAERAQLDYVEFKKRVQVEYWVETEDAISENLADKMTFISYSRQSEESLNIDNYLKKNRITVPESLRKVGVVVYQSVRLQ